MFNKIDEYELEANLVTLTLAWQSYDGVVLIILPAQEELAIVIFWAFHFLGWLEDQLSVLHEGERLKDIEHLFESLFWVENFFICDEFVFFNEDEVDEAEDEKVERLYLLQDQSQQLESLLVFNQVDQAFK